MDTLLDISNTLKEIWWHPAIIILAFVIVCVGTLIIANKEIKDLQQEILAIVNKAKHKVRKMNRKRIESRDISKRNIRKRDPNQ